MRSLLDVIEVNEMNFKDISTKHFNVPTDRE